MLESIRKFGLSYSDFPTMLSNVSSMLRLLSLNIDGRNANCIPIACIVLTVISSICYLYGYVFSGIWFTFWRSRELGVLSAAFVEFSLMTTSEISFIKLVYMMFHRETLKTLTKKYLDCDARIVKGSRFATNMLKYLRDVKKRGITFWMILMIDAAVYIIKPFVTSGRQLTADGFVIYGLEPMLESPNFEIASIVMTIDILFICFTVANVTCFLILIIGYIEAQMLSLSEEITNVWGDALNHFRKTQQAHYNLRMDMGYMGSIDSLDLYYKDSEEKIVNNYIKKQLVATIERHAMNVSYLREIEDVMRGPNVIGFLLLIMGLIAELLGGFELTWLQLPFTMLQLSVDCYLGQKIMDSNETFERAVYNCKWEMFNQSNRKIVLVMLQNSQKTMTLSVGGMATLNFICLMSVIKTAYSAYTTLRSMV